MSNYYSKREAKVNIAHYLFNNGWEVYGYKADESDSMTDYYNPAHWDGIAAKNGFTLVVDNKYAGNSGKIEKRNTSVKNTNYSKIEKLSKMTIENGCTEAEANSAQEMINKLKQNNDKEVISNVWPVFSINPNGCMWHIEKDGAIVVKGRSLTIFADVPDSYMFDINTMQYIGSYKNVNQYNFESGEYETIERTLNDKESKAVKSFKEFINKIESTVAVKIGEGQEDKLIKIVEDKITIKKEKQIIDRKNHLEINDIVYVDSSTGYVRITGIEDTIYRSIKISNRTFKDSKARFNTVNLSRDSFDRSLNNGYLKVYNIIEVEHIEKIEKWVKDTSNKKVNKTKETNINDDKKEPISEVAADTTEIKDINDNKIEVKVILNDEKNGVELHFNDKPSEEVRNSMKANGFRYSKPQKMWYAKQSEKSLNFANSLNLNTEDELKETSEQYKIDKEIDLQNKIDEIDINDIENYSVPEDISKRENQNSMFRKNDINHTKELQNTLQSANDDVLELLDKTTDLNIKYRLVTTLQRFKKNYAAAMVDYLRVKSMNPSWALTGRAGRSASRDKKMNDRQNNKMFKCGELVDKFNSDMKKIKNEIIQMNKRQQQKNVEEYTKDIEIPKFKRIKKEYNINATSSKNIFELGERMSTSTMHEYNNYYIFKNWGCYRVYTNEGKEIYSTKTTETLEDAKKWLLYHLKDAENIA